MPGSRAALACRLLGATLIEGGGLPSVSMRLGTAKRCEAYWASAWLDALDVMLATPIGQTDELLAASERVRAIEQQWDAAQWRLDRARAEAGGRRWLRVAELDEPGGGSLKAFIGEPHDGAGNAVSCAQCDRRATSRVGGEPRCSWHLTDTLPAAARRGLEASRRDRRRREERDGA